MPKGHDKGIRDSVLSGYFNYNIPPMHLAGRVGISVQTIYTWINRVKLGKLSVPPSSVLPPPALPGVKPLFPDHTVSVPVAAGSNIPIGSIVALDSDGYATVAVNQTGIRTDPQPTRTLDDYGNYTERTVWPAPPGEKPHVAWRISIDRNIKETGLPIIRIDCQSSNVGFWTSDDGEQLWLAGDLDDLSSICSSIVDSIQHCREADKK